MEKTAKNKTEQGPQTWWTSQQDSDQLSRPHVCHLQHISQPRHSTWLIEERIRHAYPQRAINKGYLSPMTPAPISLTPILRKHLETILGGCIPEAHRCTKTDSIYGAEHSITIGFYLEYTPWWLTINRLKQHTWKVNLSSEHMTQRPEKSSWTDERYRSSAYYLLLLLLRIGHEASECLCFIVYISDMNIDPSVLTHTYTWTTQQCLSP